VAKYRDYSYEQSRLLAVSLKNQIRPGTIEYTIYYLVDHEFEKNLGKVVESIEETFGVCQLRKKCLRSSASKVRQATKIDAGIRHKQNSAVQQMANDSTVCAAAFSIAEEWERWNRCLRISGTRSRDWLFVD
jgi:hypothetical protein